MYNFNKSLTKLQKQLTGSSGISISGTNGFCYSTSDVNRDSQFYIGSVTKHMTAYMLLARLQELFPYENIEDLLREKLIDLFPSSQFLNAIKKSWVTQISLLDLLTHQSGLSEYLDPYSSGVYAAEALNEPVSATKLLQAISFDPSKEHYYSNTNYFLLGKLIEEMTGCTYEEVFNRHIKLPSRMLHSSAPVTGNYFYYKGNDRYPRLTPNLNGNVFIDMANAIGSGNVISTIDDLNKWADYLFNKAPKSICDLMLSNYGTDSDGDIINLGFTQSETACGPLIGHQGGLDSYSSFFGFIPALRYTIIILSNNYHDLNLLMEAVIDQILQLPASIFNLNAEKLTYFWNKEYYHQQRLRIFSQEHNKVHPNAERDGYGAGALVVYKQPRVV